MDDPPKLRAVLSITDIDAALWIARREIAKVLRAHADQMTRPAGPDQLRRLADIFETGQVQDVDE